MTIERVTELLQTPAPVRTRSRLPHRAWLIAAVSFVTLIGAAGFRSVPSVLMDPLHAEFGWSHATISAAVSVNLLLYGLISPFAAALMERVGLRIVVACALTLVAAGSGLTVFMTASWQLLLCWGLLVGIGVGSMAMTFVATVTGRWFVRHRGLVTGVLTAAGATGQLVFLPLVAALATRYGWRTPALVVAACALAVVPLVWLFLRDFPSDVGTTAYGAPRGSTAGQRVVATGGALRALTVLRGAARRPMFWLLAGGFAVCGASTNGLVGTHFVTAAHDHGMPQTTAASLLALVGVFDVGGTILSGWLTDRWDPRWLLVGYYTGLLRAGLDRDGAADRGVVPRVVRGGRADRVRLGVRLAPGGRRADGRGCRRHPRPAGQLRPGLVPGGRLVRSRRPDVRPDQVPRSDGLSAR